MSRTEDRLHDALTGGRLAMDKTALLIIDAQQEYFAPIGKVVLPAGPRAVGRIAETLRWARESRMPVFHIVHESRRPGATTLKGGFWLSITWTWVGVVWVRNNRSLPR